MKGAGARGRDSDMRRKPLIRVNFVRRKGQDRPVRGIRRQVVEGGEEEADVADRLVEITVARHQVQDDGLRAGMGGGRDVQGLRRRR